LRRLISVRRRFVSLGALVAEPAKTFVGRNLVQFLCLFRARCKTRDVANNVAALAYQESTVCTDDAAACARTICRPLDAIIEVSSFVVTKILSVTLY